MQQFFYEFTKLSFENLNRHIRLADNKAKFLLSLNLAVISGISAFAYNSFDKFKAHEFGIKEGLIVTLFLLSIVSLLLSFFFTILIIMPKLSPSNNPSKLLYWGQIVKQDIQEIQNSYWNTSEDEKMSELINQIYFYSHTATEKYRRVKISIIALFVALVLLLAALITSFSSL